MAADSGWDIGILRLGIGLFEHFDDVIGIDDYRAER